MKRIISFDVVRSISILWIICIWHSGIGYLIMGSVSYELTIVVLSAFTFMSGFFMKKKSVCDFTGYGNFLSGRIKRLGIPFVLVSLVYYLVGWYIDIKQFFLSIVGLSLIVAPPVKTLWYISMIVLFYFLTPLVSARKSIYSRFIWISGIIIFFVFLNNTIITIDKRLIYYMLFYFLSMCVSDELMLKIVKSHKIMIVIFALFIILLGCAFFNSRNFVLEFFLSWSGIVCLIKIGDLISTYQSKMTSLFIYISYGSMMAYLIHRLIFMAYNCIFGYNYMLIITVPLIFTLSYYLQHAYDTILNQLKDKSI